MQITDLLIAALAACFCIWLISSIITHYYWCLRRKGYPKSDSVLVAFVGFGALFGLAVFYGAGFGTILAFLPDRLASTLSIALGIGASFLAFILSSKVESLSKSERELKKKVRQLEYEIFDLKSDKSP